MQITILPLQQLDQAALISMADLHHQVMRTLLAELGLPIVRRYYQVAQSDSDSTGMCALDEEGRAVGWAFGSTEPARLTRALQKPLSWFLFEIFKAAFTTPISLHDLIGSLLADPSPNQLKPGQIELTYIGVTTAAQSNGLGRLLLDEFCAAARQKGFSSVALSVETNNSHAIQLYTRKGFHIICTFHEGRFERHRMEYPLPA